MSKRTTKQVRKDILLALNDLEERSYGYLERKVNTNWETVRNHCDDLSLFNAVSISEENKVKITKEGLRLLSKL